jgi:hypothetical protein
MAKNWGRTPITNADKRRDAIVKYFVQTEDGTELRTDRRPLGKIEQFVDPDGNICNQQMFGDGDSQKLNTEQRLRHGLHRKGFIEYAKCPIRHGNRQYAQREFAKMPADLARECEHDPRPFERLNAEGGPARRGEPSDLYAREACPHIEWLIKHRRKEAEAKALLLNPHAKAAEKAKQTAQELQAAQIELVKEQIAERKTRRKVKDGAE